MRSCGLQEREKDANAGALSNEALDLDAAFVFFEDLFADDQSKPSAVRFGGVESVKDLLLVLGGDATSVVFDLDKQVGFMDATREVKSLLRSAGRIKSIEGVEDEVEKELAHLFWIDPQERDFVKLEVVSDMFEPMFARKGDQVKDFSEIGLLALGFVASAQEAVFGEEVAEAFDLVGDHIESVVESERSDIGAHGLDHGLDTREGVADLVDHHGGESAHFGEFFEPCHLPLEVFELGEVAEADEDLFLLVGRSDGGTSIAENTGIGGSSDA